LPEASTSQQVHHLLQQEGDTKVVITRIGPPSNVTRHRMKDKEERKRRRRRRRKRSYYLLFL